MNDLSISKSTEEKIYRRLQQFHSGVLLHVVG